MEFCKPLFVALFIVATMNPVAWTAPLSYRPSDAEIVIRLSLMPTRSNATKEVGYRNISHLYPTSALKAACEILLEK